VGDYVPALATQTLDAEFHYIIGVAMWSSIQWQALVVVVGSTAATDGEGPDVGDLRGGHAGAFCGGPWGNTKILLALLRPRARSSKLCGAPSQPTRPSISAWIPSGTVPTQSAVWTNSSAL
jgi:hypothetical protein